jgi:Polysaccharide deacetylase
MPIIVLAYHSHNIGGRQYANNDHIALAKDLDVIEEAGAQVVPLDVIASILRGESEARPSIVQVGLSFDDGPIFDVEDFEHARFGPQRSFLNVMRDFRARHGPDRQPHLHATSFVIASAEARRAMELESASEFGLAGEWLSDGWWKGAVETGLIGIGNHSWDHVHHAAPRVAADVPRRDDFSLVVNAMDAEAEIDRATEYINERVGGTCTLFAFPFGHVNDFLVHDYLPRRQDRHGMRAAFGTGGGAVAAGDSVWNIPRLVCGYHWRSPGELARLLAC